MVKINQKDHAQGHICPDTAKWIRLGPAGIRAEAAARADVRVARPARVLRLGPDRARRLDGVHAPVRRPRHRDGGHGRDSPERVANLREIARICNKLAASGADTFHEAVQSLWFLFALLHLESNASSFSPGRADQYLYPYYRADLDAGRLDRAGALELIEALWLKFNQIVYLRNSHSASFFAGFPIGFNVAFGGRDERGRDESNELSYLFLEAQSHILLPQPNLSARLHENTPDALLDECTRVIGLGSGMPQVFNDESIIPALEAQGIAPVDAVNYAIVGCVELTTHGNNLGWSRRRDVQPRQGARAGHERRQVPAHGRAARSAHRLPHRLRDATRTSSAAFAAQIDYFFEKMIEACEKVEEIHQRLLPSALLSSVIDDCLDRGLDVTRGGAHYNLSGIQVIQVANVADSLAAVKKLVFDEGTVDKARLVAALQTNYEHDEELRQVLLNKAPKYGNDVPWVDEIGNQVGPLLRRQVRGAHELPRRPLPHRALHGQRARPDGRERRRDAGRPAGTGAARRRRHVGGLRPRSPRSDGAPLVRGAGGLPPREQRHAPQHEVPAAAVQVGGGRARRSRRCCAGSSSCASTTSSSTW